MPPIVLNGDTGITTPTYGGAVAAEYIAPVTSFKNRIINGAMVIDQRNAGASVTPVSTQYLLDRWQAILTQTAKYSAQQNAGAVTPPVGFTNYLGVVSLSSHSLAAGDFYQVKQHLEGFNVADFAWGTASASPITVSFWVRSSLTGNFGLVISWGSSGSNQRSYPILYSIASTNTWEYKTITIPGDTTMPAGGFETGNGSSIQLRFSLGGGATNAGTSGAWATANSQTVTGDTSVVGTNGATFYLTGVQLEKGSTATSFDYRPYGQELALCQRYFARLGSGSTGYVFNGTNGDFGVQFPTAMRTTPSVSHLDNYSVTNPATATYTATNTALSSGSTGTNGLMIRITSSGMSAATCIISSDNNIGFSAEL
jgi:hypothetical protein